MRQHMINLLPESIRVRAQTGVYVRRATALFLAAIALLVALTIHARVGLHRARELHAVTEARANHALAMEARSNELEVVLDADQSFIDRHERIDSPLDLTHVVSTLISALPSSVTLEQIDLTTARPSRSPRTQGDGDGAAPRILRGEIAGFAVSDAHIAKLVASLADHELFREVRLDFSRSRPVRERPARAFRLSFRIDLDVDYEVRLVRSPFQDTTDVD